MSSVYRLRPLNTKTIEELKDNYLWFSRPIGFNDIEDSNVVAFVESNESIRESFDRVFNNYLEIGKDASFTGICCFTDSLPKINSWKKFPNGRNGLFIEYDKQVLEDFFVKCYGIGDCFKSVEYIKEPLTLEKHDDYHILWEKESDGNTFYESLWNIEHSPKLMDMLFLKLFTQINIKFKEQKESRIIFGGKNIVDLKSYDIKGYKIQIPIESIKRIYIQPNTPQSIIEELKSTLSKSIQIIELK